MLAVKRWKGVTLVTLGILFCIIGLLVGTNVLPNALLKRLKEATCVDSAQSSSYDSWVGSLSEYNDFIEMRIRYWNITNKHGFLYNGEIPVVTEVGPYVYRTSSQKKDIVFSSDDVSYKSLASTKYDAAATKLLCPKCAETDKVTVPNSVFIGLTLRSGGDVQLAMMFIPAAVHFLFSSANATGLTQMQTLEQFGNFTSTVLTSNIHGAPSGWSPAGFGPWLAAQNNSVASPLYGMLKNSKRNGFNLTEMMALNSVITSPSLLGTAGNATVLKQCMAEPTVKGCGYLFYLKVYRARRMQRVPPNDTILLETMKNMQELFCQSHCLRFDRVTFIALSIYVTDHLAKLAIHLAIDRNDFGPLMTRTVKELAHGFTVKDLKIPPMFPDGLVVPGSLPSDTVHSDAVSRKFYTCQHSTKAFQFKEYNNSQFTSLDIYPNSSLEFRKIEGYDKSFGFKKPSLCEQQLSPPQNSYVMFDDRLMLKYKIHYKESKKIGEVKTNVFEADRKSLFSKESIAVFREGLIDMSKIAKGLPIVVSMPHYLHADQALVKLFKTKPDASAHNSFFFIEPLSGRPVKLQQRTQLNVAIPEQSVQARRQQPLNITYKEKANSQHYSQVIPMSWIDLNVMAPNDKLEMFERAYKVMEGACVAAVVGCLLGASFFILGVFIVVKSVKSPIHSQTDVD